MTYEYINGMVKTNKLKVQIRGCQKNYLVDAVVATSNGGIIKAKTIGSANIPTKDLIDLTEFVRTMTGHELSVKNDTAGDFVCMRTGPQKFFSIMTNVTIIRTRTTNASQQGPINDASQTNKLMNSISSG